ncbi:hypothetical protein FOZ60_015138 [Perkinsus olseni]|uniref:Uncharacterized protein n=1 Tax=Perkinsus olseni TaxID=32597 RepID=A0A7J6N6I3_PEROL|nr:hypothetical protein FOZ60_015138 [Perkinsus olseni]
MKNGYATPTLDCVQVMYSALQYPTSSCYETVRTSWKCPSVANLAIEAKKWLSQIDKSVDLIKVKDAAGFQRQLQRSLDLLENECGFNSPLTFTVVVYWLMDTSCPKRLVVRTAIHDWLIRPTGSSKRSDESAGVIDYFNADGYRWLISSDWESGWSSLAAYVINSLISSDRGHVDLVKLRQDWLNTKQKTDSAPLYLSKESEAYQLYTDALLRFNLALPSTFDRVTSLIGNSNADLRAYVSKTIRDNEAKVHDLSYGDCQDMFMKFHRKTTMVLPWDDPKNAKVMNIASPSNAKGATTVLDKPGSTVSTTSARNQTSGAGDKQAKDNELSKKPRCKWCRRRGHKESDCWFKPDASSAQGEKDESSPSATATQGQASSESSGKQGTNQNNKAGKKGKPYNPNFQKKTTSKSTSSGATTRDSGAVTRSQTGKLPATTPSSYSSNKTFAILPKMPEDGDVNVCAAPGSGSVKLLYIDLGISEKNLPYQCILDTASCYTLVGPGVLGLPGVTAEPVNSSASTFSGHTLDITHEVILPVSLGTDHKFNVRAHVCATESLLRSDQLLFGLGTLSNMGAVIDLDEPSVHFSALKVNCKLYPVGDPPGVAVVQSADTVNSGNDDDADLDQIFSGFSLPTANFGVSPSHPTIRPVPWRGYDPTRQEKLTELLGELESQGVIEKVSPDQTEDLHVSRAFAIRKKELSEDGEVKWRLVVDFRRVNSRLTTETEDLREYVDSADRMVRSIPSTAKWYALVDVSNAFHCIPITAQSTSAVGVTDGQSFWKYRRLPQGLSCSPLWWGYAMKVFLSTLTGEDLSSLEGCGYCSYVDDIVVYADTKELCERRLRRLLKALTLAGLTPNYKKTQPVSSSVEVCGIVLDNGGWYLSSSHQQQIRDMVKKIPTTPYELRSALGIIQYNRSLWSPSSLDASATDSLASLARPFYDVLLEYNTKGQGNSKRVRLRWDDDLQRAWDKLFSAVSLKPQNLHQHGELLPPDWVWVITCDSSDRAGAGALWRCPRPQDLSNVDHAYLNEHAEIIDHWSESYHGPATRWPIFDRECYALVRSLVKFKTILISTLGIPTGDGGGSSSSSSPPDTDYDFVVMSDNTTTLASWRNLTFPTDGVRGRRFITWQEKVYPLCHYRVLWKFIPGHTNFIADVFSRALNSLVPIPPSDLVFAIGADSGDSGGSSSSGCLSDVVLRRRIAEAQRYDITTKYSSVTLADIYEALQDAEVVDDTSTPAHRLCASGRFTLDDDGVLLIYIPIGDDYRWVPFLPIGGDFRDYQYVATDDSDDVDRTKPMPIREFILWMVHDCGGHPGRTRSYNLLRDNCWFPGMANYVRSYCRSCPYCAPRRLPHQPPTPATFDLPPRRRFQDIALDHVDPRRPAVNGLDHILTITCLTSGFTLYCPMSSTSSSATALVLYSSWISVFGWPRRILSDNSSSYTSQLWQDLGLLCGVRLTRSTPYYPASNGQVERKNGDLRRLLDLFPNEHRWDLLCKLAQLMVNFTTESHSKPSPSMLAIGLDHGHPTPLHLLLPDSTERDDVPEDVSEDWNQLMNLKTEVMTNISTWLDAFYGQRCDQRLSTSDAQVASGAQVPEPLQVGQKVYWKPPRGGSGRDPLQPVPAVVLNCLIRRKGVYSIRLEKDSKVMTVNGRYLIPVDDFTHRGVALRTAHMSTAAFEKGDVLLIEFLDDNTKIYFGEFLYWTSTGRLMVQPLELKG